jgi:hypothetical protein
MKKWFFAAFAVVLLAISASAQSATPVIKCGSLTKSGSMKAEDLKNVQELTLVDGGDQTIVGFTAEIIGPDGKLISHAPIGGSKIPAEFQTMISRQHPGNRIVITNVRIKDEKTANTKVVDGFTIDII